MHRRRLTGLEGYEVIGRPVVGATRLTYEPWVAVALRPYGATRLPRGTRAGLTAALQRARLTAALQPDLALAS